MRFRALCLPLLVGVLFLSVVGVASVSAEVELEYELAYDDGGFESAKVLGEELKVGLVQKFVLSDFDWLPSGTYKVKAVKVYWGPWVADTVTFDIKLLRVSSFITALRDQVSTAGWQRYDDVSRAGFTSDEYFYVMLIPSSGAEYVGLDTNRFDHSAWSTDGGYTLVPESTGTYGIRVFVSQVLGPVPEFSLSIPIITSIATLAYLAIRKRISRKLE